MNPNSGSVKAEPPRKFVSVTESKKVSTAHRGRFCLLLIFREFTISESVNILANRLHLHNESVSCAPAQGLSLPDTGILRAHPQGPYQ